MEARAGVNLRADPCLAALEVFSFVDALETNFMSNSLFTAPYALLARAGTRSVVSFQPPPLGLRSMPFFTMYGSFLRSRISVMSVLVPKASLVAYWLARGEVTL